MPLRPARRSLFVELARSSPIRAERMRGTATLTESIETSDSDESVAPLVLTSRQ